MKLFVQFYCAFTLIFFLTSFDCDAAEKPNLSAELPSIELFFENPKFSNAVLSPNGKLVAMLIGKKDIRQLLAVYEISTSKVTIVASFGPDDAR